MAVKILPIVFGNLVGSVGGGSGELDCAPKFLDVPHISDSVLH